MKLRNKETKEIGNFIINKDHFECVDLDYVSRYCSLSELLEDWEDLKPVEPLIKDPKIRKAVRVWAEANDFCAFKVRRQHLHSCKIIGSKYKHYPHGSSIEFSRTIAGLNDPKITYTITELCGDEEE